METLGGLFALFGFGLFATAAFAMFKPLPKLRMGSRKAAAVGMALSVGSCVMGGALMPPTTAEDAPEQAAVEAAAPAAPAPPAELPTLASRVRTIREASVAGSQLNVRIFIDSAWDDAAYVDAAGLAVTDIARALQKGVREDGPDVQRVSVEVHVAGVDRLGNDTELHLMGAHFPAADLRAAKTQNLSDARMLNLASDAWSGSPAGTEALSAWCERNLQDAMQFCQLALL